MLTVVTSFSKTLWDAYALHGIASWLKHLKGDWRLVITIDGPVPDDLPHGMNLESNGSCESREVTVVSLDNLPGYAEFLFRSSVVQMPEGVNPNDRFRFEFRRFWPKVFSINMVVQDGMTAPENSPILWLDADMVLFKDLEVVRMVKDLVHNRNPLYEGHYDLVCLDRGQPWNYMDSGYLLFSGNSDKISDALFNTYVTGAIFHFREWHDAFLLSRVLDILGPEFYAENVLSLSGKVDTHDPNQFLNPIAKTWLGEYLIHFKGNRKGEIQ